LATKSANGRTTKAGRLLERIRTDTGGEEGKPSQGKESKEEESSKYPTDDIPRRPVRILHIPFGDAHMLATLPRSRLGEFFAASLVGFVASLPGGWDGLQQAFFKVPREPVAPYSLVEMGVSLVLLTVAISSLATKVGHQTSLQYLANLCETTTPSNLGWKAWWAARPKIITRRVSFPPAPARPDTPAGM
jgi:hypothetical protein